MEHTSQSISDEKKDIVAITIMRCMLLPYAQDNNIPFEEALLRFCESETYEALFDFSSEIWKEGPVYLRGLFDEEIMRSQSIH